MYILRQIEEVDLFFDEYRQKFETLNIVNEDFLKWFRSHIQELKAVNDPRCTDDMEVLSRTPSRFAYSHSGYIVNGFRFRTKTVDDTKLTQLSGVIVAAELESGCDGYYGRLLDVVEICFNSEKRVILFECDWWDVYRKHRGFEMDKYGIISLNTHLKLNTNEPFALASQVEQVFYVDDNNASGWIIPIRAPPRDYYNMQIPQTEVDDAADLEEAYQETLINVPVIGEICDVDILQGINVRVDEYIDDI